MGKKIELTKQTENKIIKLYKNSVSIEKIKDLTNLSRCVIDRVLTQNGCKKALNSNKNEDKYKKYCLPAFLEGMSLTQISKQYKISRGSLAIRLKQDGYTIINKQNLTKFNEHIFDEIDTEEKAYWLGFLYADGYLSKNNYTIELSLKLSDVEHLIKFNKFIQYNKNQVKCDSYRCRFFVTNKHLWTVLNNYGCTPQKSLTLTFPDINIFKDVSLIKHFMRGYFDGDGCITRRILKHTVNIRTSILGTPEFLSTFESHLNFNTSIKKYHDKRHSDQTISLDFSKQQSLDLLDFLYKDATIYLNRKFKLYNFFKDKGSRSIQEWIELSQSNIGESWDANSEITEETKESSASYSVETEPDLSE